MSRLLARLDAELVGCRSQSRWVEIHAERACYFAKVGRFSEAKSIIQQLRKKHGEALLGRGIVRVMIAEGLVHYFENVSVSARDRFFRAYLVSTLTGDPDLGRLACAWVAHVDFDQGAYVDAFSNLEKAFDGLERTELAALSRVGLILGDAYLYVGERQRAQFWYERARHAAVDEGDQASLGAVMYNRSAFGVSRLLVEKYAFGRDPDEQALRFCEMELDSAWEFQKGTNVRALIHLIDVCRSRVLLLQRKFVDAKKLLTHTQANIESLEDRPNRNKLTVELAYAQYMSGDVGSASRTLDGWDLVQLQALDVDDRLVALGMLQSEMKDVAEVWPWYSSLDGLLQQSLGEFEAESGLLKKGLGALDEVHRIRLDIRSSPQ